MIRTGFSIWISIGAMGLFLLVANNAGFAQQGPQADRSDFVSDASFIVGTYAPPQREHTPAAMANAANAFLDSLDEKQRAECVDDLASPQRREWTNLPPRGNADGVRLGDLNSEQIKRVCDLMANLFSEHGYNKMREIMLADDQLLKGGRPRAGIGTVDFAIVLFGTPSESDPWAFQLDGHHIGVNLSMEGDKMTMSPSFIGTQPQAFKIAGTEYRPFKNETGLAHELAMSLNREQILQAVQNPNRVPIVTGPGRDNQVPNLEGILCSKLNEDQQKLLMSLISQWVNDLPEAHATKRMEQIQKEIDEMKFGWNGNREPGSVISYTIQSPSLIIEYACQGRGNGALDHLHSNYRDPTNEYGKQLK